LFAPLPGPEGPEAALSSSQGNSPLSGELGGFGSAPFVLPGLEDGPELGEGSGWLPLLGDVAAPPGPTPPLLGEFLGGPASGFPEGAGI
jgi:hypothetical protein